jgi:putative colanic acid biosynthesis acetyltransferase WcaF
MAIKRHSSTTPGGSRHRMNKNELIKNKAAFVGPTFTLRNQLERLLWTVTWFLLIRFSPPQAHKYRILILKLFGANVSWNAYIYPNVSIWAPWNLHMDDYATLGRNVICYNISPISIGRMAVVSQNVHLCTGTHDYRDPAFPLYARPIAIGRRAWICADSFVGPGVTVHDGAILGAVGVAKQDLDAWTIYAGNPARPLKSRVAIKDELLGC